MGCNQFLLKPSKAALRRLRILLRRLKILLYAVILVEAKVNQCKCRLKTWDLRLRSNLKKSLNKGIRLLYIKFHAQLKTIIVVELRMKFYVQ